jgi:hypothetical protein
MKINQLVNESQMTCSECGGPAFSDLILAEKKDACYQKVKASAKVWPSAYASGRLVQCRKKGAANYGNKSESVAEGIQADYLTQVFDQILDGELDAYDVMNHPRGGAQEYVAMVLQDMYDDVARENRLHPDDNFEEILDIVVDRIEKDYGHSAEQGMAEAAKWRDPKYQGQTFAYDDSYEGPGDTRAGKVSLDRAGMRQLSGQTFDPLEYKAREKQATGKLTPQDVKYATAKNFEKEKQQQLDYDRSEGVAEDYNPEYDDEAGMADNNLETLSRAVDGIDDLIQSGDNLPEWCQEKIAVAKSMLVAVWDYMYSEEASDEVDPEVDEMFEAMEDLVSEMAQKNRVSEDLVWESFEALPDNVLYETAAWRRKEGKSKKGGLNAKGVASYRRENPGSKLQMAVTTKPSKLKPGSKAAKRRKSFCARMSGVKGPMKKPNGKPTRKALALRKWNC